MYLTKKGLTLKHICENIMSVFGDNALSYQITKNNGFESLDIKKKNHLSFT